MSKKEEIIAEIRNSGVNPARIAEQMGINSSTLSILLNENDEIEDDLYQQLKEILSAHQYELEIFDPSGEIGLDLFDNNDLEKSIGERIRIFARKNFGTLKKLAESIDMSPQQLQQYISGNREPGAKILLKLLNTGCDINWLLSGNEKIQTYRTYKLEKEVKSLRSKIRKINMVLGKNET